MTDVAGRARSALDFFGLREQPFAPTADPAYFYATGAHKECLFRMWSSVDERHGIAVILGHYGTGKTTLLRKLISGMAADPERYNTAVVGSPIPSWTSFSLLESIVAQFGLRPETRSFMAYVESLNRYLMTNRQRVNTLIIDDAQNLNKRGQLELLRLVQNLETPQHKLLNLLLFAQMEWMEVLRAAPNFQQRVNMTFTLTPLSMSETRDFIDFRLVQAGADLDGEVCPAIDDPAVCAIHAYAEGSPRVTVTLCRNALVVAAWLKTRDIGDDLVLHTIEKTMLPDREKRVRVLTALEGLKGEAPLSALAEAAEFEPDPVLSADRDERASQLLLRAAKARRVDRHGYDEYESG